MTIKLDPANKGKLRDKLHAKKGDPIPAAKLDKAAKSKSPALRKEAQFAINAKKFKH